MSLATQSTASVALICQLVAQGLKDFLRKNCQC